MQLKKQSTEKPALRELIVVPHYKNRAVVQHYGRMTMQMAMDAKTATISKLGREEGQDKIIESLGRVFIATSMYFDKALSTEEAEIVAVEMLNDYEMSNLKLEDVVVIVKELKESDMYGRLTPNKIIKHIKKYWERRIKTAVTNSINHSQSTKQASDMSERIKKTVALPTAQLKRVDRTRKENTKYFKP